MSKEIWYQQPAETFLQALPIGNGSLGGMVYSGYPNAKISLNRDTFWSGNGKKSSKKVTRDQMETLRKYIFDDCLKEAEDMTVNEMISSDYTQSYMPIGSLNYMFSDQTPISDYKRYLDMENGLVTCEFKQNGNKIISETFSSKADDLILVNIKSEKPGGINLSVSLDCPLKHQVLQVDEKVGMLIDAPSHATPNYIDVPKHLIYKEDEKGMVSGAILGVTSTDGIISLNGVVYEVELASEVTLILSVATGYKGFNRPLTTDSRVLANQCNQEVENVLNKPYKNLREKHTRLWKDLFSRVSFYIESSDEELPIDHRLEKVKNGYVDKGLGVTYFNYGRYLMIASSSKGSQPTTLQGIWSEKPRPEWSCNYTLNINTEMNYWMANVCNLYECEEPLVKLLEELSESGKETAKETFGTRGWVTCHNTDIWRMSLPINVGPKHGYWPMGGVWLTAHLYNRYLYSLDESYLLDTAYPIMKGAGEFCLDWLVEKGDGYLHTCPSTSPENSFYDKDHNNCSVTYSSAMDLGLVKELFENILATNKQFNNDPLFAEEVEKAYKRLPEFQVGSKGQLLEWFEEYEEYEPGHRHVSPLYGLFPGQTINEYDTPELMEACDVFLKERIAHGGGHTGWSCAWLINLYARLGQGDKAFYYLNYLLRSMTADNMFDLHPPLGLTVNESEVFQIDGNFGTTSGIALLLLQSIKDEIRLLPALPEEWDKGHINGLRAIGGFEINMAWEQGVLLTGQVISHKGGTVKLAYKKPIRIYKDNISIHTSIDKYGRIVFDTQEGEIYTFET